MKGVGSTINVPEVAPAAMVRLGPTDTPLAIVLPVASEATPVSATVTPPAGAALLNVTVPVANGGPTPI